MKHVNPSVLAMAGAIALTRGIQMVHADVGDPRSLVEALNRAFEEFKAEHNKQLSDLRKDVVQAEKVDRINAAITDLQAAVDRAARDVAALQVGAGGGKPINPAAAEHARAFNQFFRKGIEAGLRELEVKASLRTDSDPDGGYLVPEEMAGTIDRILGTVSAMRSLAQVVTVSTNAYKKPINLGGAGSGWVGEREARTETNTPSLAVLDFPVMELYANPAATQTMLDDGRIDIAQWLGDEVSVTFAEAEGAAFISGSGINRPRGILQYDTVANASYAWGNLGFIVTGAAADFATEDPGDALIDLVYGLKQGYRQNARFLMNRNVQAKIRKFKDDQDNYLWAPGIQAGQPATLLGYAITDDDNMPDVGANVFPVAFGDFRRGYLIVDRFGIRVLRDPFTNKPYVHFYTTKRVGGGVQNFEAMKLLKCST